MDVWTKNKIRHSFFFVERDLNFRRLFFFNLLTISYKNVLGGKKKNNYTTGLDVSIEIVVNELTCHFYEKRSGKRGKVKERWNNHSYPTKNYHPYDKQTTRQFYKKLWIHTIQCKSLNSYRRALMIRRRRIWLYIGTYTYSFSLASLAIICVDRFLHHMWEFFEDTDISSDHDFTQDDFLDSRSWKILIKNLQYLIVSCRVCTSKTIIIQIDI